MSTDRLALRIIFGVVAFPAILVMGALAGAVAGVTGFINGVLWATGIIIDKESE